MAERATRLSDLGLTARAGRDPASESGRDLRPRREVLAPGRRGVDERAPAGVDDDHTPPGLGSVVRSDAPHLG